MSNTDPTPEEVAEHAWKRGYTRLTCNTCEGDQPTVTYVHPDYPVEGVVCRPCFFTWWRVEKVAAWLPPSKAPAGDRFVTVCDDCHKEVPDDCRCKTSTVGGEDWPLSRIVLVLLAGVPVSCRAPATPFVASPCYT